MSDWETVIGLEVHCQLATRSKLFSGASTAFGAEPNTQACAVDLALPGGVPGQRLQLGAEQERPATVPVVQRLLAHAVARQEQRAFGGIPQREREHAVQALQRTLDAPVAYRREQGFGVRMPAPVEAGARRVELGAQVAVVVNLAVVGNDETPARRHHRLVTGWGRIENGQPAMGEPDAGRRVPPTAAVIRPAVPKGVAQSLQNCVRAVHTPT